MTYLEHLLAELPPEYANKAVANARQSSHSNDPAEDTISETLISAFVWDASPEGFNFWNDLYNELREKEKQN